MTNSNIFEGLEQSDLARLIHPELHVDEFKSKLGRDEDVCVISFKVTGKEPAQDLVNFVEKGYQWVIDADVSSGEMDDGDYIVFVEAEREDTLPKNIISMMKDVMNLTGQELSQWRVRYQHDGKDHDLTEENLKKLKNLEKEKNILEELINKIESEPKTIEQIMEESKLINLENSENPDSFLPNNTLESNILEDSLNKIDLISVSKDDNHKSSIIHTIDGKTHSILSNTTFSILGKVQEEVHRFVINFHRQKQSKKLLN